MNRDQVFLVRHAKAGSRRAWPGPDEARPLSKAGRRQALGVAELLAGDGVGRVLASPYVRCVQTVEPLAERLGLAVETSPFLAEGSLLADALRLVEKVADQRAVLCTHGDVIEAVLFHARRHGVVDGEARLEKGSTWVLDVEGDEITRAAYLPPPS